MTNEIKNQLSNAASGIYVLLPDIRKLAKDALDTVELLEHELTIERQTRRRLESVHYAAMDAWRAESPSTDTEMALAMANTEINHLKGKLAGAQAAAWRTAITFANNICIQESDHANEEDDIDRADAASTCARRIREYLNIPNTERNELIAECAGIPPAQPEGEQ